MLILSCREGEGCQIMVGKKIIRVAVQRIGDQNVRLAFEAPRSISVLRDKLIAPLVLEAAAKHLPADVPS